MLASESEDGFDLVLAPHENLKQLYWSMQRKGFSESESANLIARMMGLPQNAKDWTIKELQHIAALKHTRP